MNGTLNKIILIGHLGDDIKIHYFEKGNCIARCPVATHEVHINKATGERITTTEWHQVVFKNRAAEVCEKHLSKGDRIYIEGRLKSRQWQSSDGQMRHTTEVIVSEFTFLNVKKSKSGQEQQRSDGFDEEDDDFDIPRTNESENEENDYPF